MTNYLESQFGLSGKRAIVTGAGRGIGRAIAEALAYSGAQVCVHFHTSESAARDVCATIVKNTGDTDRAWVASADLTDSRQAGDLFNLVSNRWDGSLDILVNNAGDLVKRSPVAEFTDELLEQVLRVNIHSAVFSTRRAIPLLARGRDPVIINLSSVAAHNGGANGATIYAAAKAAIHTWTRGLAKELAPSIRVNGIAPGTILTDFHRRHTTPQNLEQIAANTPLKRLGTAEEHGAAAVFLCARSGSFITGEVIEINGGLWLA